MVVFVPAASESLHCNSDKFCLNSSMPSQAQVVVSPRLPAFPKFSEHADYPGLVLEREEKLEGDFMDRSLDLQ